MAVLESESCYPDKQFQGLSERKDGEMATTFGINIGCDKGLEDECKSGPWCLLSESEGVSWSAVSDSVTSWTVARQTPLSMGFSRQEYWSGLPFPTPGNLPHRWNLDLLHCRQILYHLSHQGSPLVKARAFTLCFGSLPWVLWFSLFRSFQCSTLCLCGLGKAIQSDFGVLWKKEKGKKTNLYVSRFYAHSIKHLLLSLIQNEEM